MSLAELPTGIAAHAEKTTQTQRVYVERWKLFALALLLLAGFTWLHVRVLGKVPEHRVYGAFVVSGQAANQHRDPYAIWPGTPSFHPYRGNTGPLIYDRNLQPPVLLPLFQAFSKFTLSGGLTLWMWGLFLLFAIGAAALLVTFRENLAPWLILLILLSTATLTTIGSGEDWAILFALAAAAACFLHRDQPTLAGISIGLLVAAHPNFGLWPVLLFVAGHRRLALTSAGIAALLTAIPAFIYGPVIYSQLLHAIATDNHSYDLDDISLTGFFTRAGHRQLGFALAFVCLCAFTLVVRRKRGADPITLGGLAACAGILSSPLGWFPYLIVALPCLATQRVNWFTRSAAVLMFLPDRAGGFFGNYGTIQFLFACILLAISFCMNLADEHICASARNPCDDDRDCG